MSKHHRQEFLMVMMVLMLTLAIPTSIRLIWNKKAVIQRMIGFQISRMTFLEWLVGLIYQITTTQGAMTREKKEIIQRFKMEKIRLLELTYNYYQGGINLLRAY